MALSALVALLQYPCVVLVQGPLQGDPFYVSDCPTAAPGGVGVLPHREMGVLSHGEWVLPHGGVGYCPLGGILATGNGGPAPRGMGSCSKHWGPGGLWGWPRAPLGWGEHP